MDIYTRNALKCSEATTFNYSTSFSLGVWMLNKKHRQAIFAIYGFVRFADEIVDTFHDKNQQELLNEFRVSTYKAIKDQFSPNPILHSFQWVVNKYRIEHDHIDAFLWSMQLDLTISRYDRTQYHKYIYGSAEVIGLMCLRVFYHDDDKKYYSLFHPARKLGEAFQKVNFLRDMIPDYQERGRVYFPEVDFEHFNAEMKRKVEEEIEADFQEAYKGIKLLKSEVRLGVYLAYRYYWKLLQGIKKARPEDLTEKRFRISNARKMILLARCGAEHSLNVL